MSILTDEHVPSVFITSLRSNGYEVVQAREVFGEATSDRRLLEYAGEHGHVLVTHDKKDFTGRLSDSVEHAGIVIYTDANFLRDDPEAAVRTLDRVFDQYPPGALADAIVWLDQWHR